MSAGDRQAAAPFLRGSFQTYPLAEIFGVLALSRQLFGVHFSDSEKEVGAIAVKAGQVIAARDHRTQTEGADALEALIGDPGAGFSVVMLPQDAPGVPAGPAIGRLAELIPETDGDEAEPAAEAAPDLSPDRDAPVAAEPQPPPAAGEPSQLSEPDDTGDTGEPDDTGDTGAPAGAGEVILHGNVSDSSFAEILEVLQLSEPALVVSFLRDGATVGTLTVKSEQVLAAAAGSLRGMAAFEGLYADHGETFEVRRTRLDDPVEPLGGVTELLAGLGRPLPPPPVASSGERSLFMRGRLSDFPLEHLIGSLDLSRQSIELELLRGGKPLHRVQIKSGRIAAAESVSADGIDAALAAIRKDPGDEFFVYRCNEPVGGPPFSSLSVLVAETDGVAGRAAERPGPVDAPAPPSPDPALAEMAQALQALSGTVNSVAELAAGLGQAQETASAELQSALAALRPGRRERVLLWSILGVQIGCLAVTLGVLAQTGL